MRIYITGIKGFIATHLKRELEDHGHTVGGGNLPEVNYWHKGVAHREFNRFKPDLVVHNAAQVGRLFGEDNIKFTIDSNALMTTRIAQAAAERGCRLCYISTSEVYGDQGETMCDESTPLKLSHNLYGLSKKWGEETCLLYHPTNLQIVRPSMPYGTGVPAGNGRAAILNFVYNALHNTPLNVHKNAERSNIWIDDLIRSFRSILENGEVITQGTSDYYEGRGIYNLGRNDDARSMEEIAVLACDLAGAPRSLINLVEAPPNQTKIKRLCCEKVRQLAGAPTTSLEEGMVKILQYYMNEKSLQGWPQSQAAKLSV